AAGRKESRHWPSRPVLLRRQPGDRPRFTERADKQNLPAEADGPGQTPGRGHRLGYPPSASRRALDCRQAGWVPALRQTLIVRPVRRGTAGATMLRLLDRCCAGVRAGFDHDRTVSQTVCRVVEDQGAALPVERLPAPLRGFL